MKKKGRTNRKKRAAAAAIILLITLIFCSCGADSTGSTGQAGSPEGPGSSGKPGDFQVPAFRASVFDEARAEGNDEVQVDISSADNGYFGVWSDADARLKMQVRKSGGEEYIYDLVPRKVDFFPFQSGNGAYTIRIMKNVEDSKYYELYSVQASVSLSSEFDPFLIPCQYADYTEDSACVEEARKIAEQSAGEKDFICQIYELICSRIKYDTSKAQTVQPGYIPDPDETLRSKKGICFDYASLAASMLRSQGIPTKIIFGYVAPDNLYHAWNMFYTEESGWTTVEFKVDPHTWNRIDLTFLANGADEQFIGNASNYTDVYQY